MAEVNEELFEAVVRSGSFSREFNLRLKTKYILHERLVWLSVCNMALSVLHSKTDSCNCFHNFSFVSSLSDSFLFAFFFSHFYLLAIDGIFNAENGIRLEPIQLGMINRNGCVVAGNGTKKKKKNMQGFHLIHRIYSIAAWHRRREDTSGKWNSVRVLPVWFTRFKRIKFNRTNDVVLCNKRITNKYSKEPNVPNPNCQSYVNSIARTMTLADYFHLLW